MYIYGTMPLYNVAAFRAMAVQHACSTCAYMPELEVTHTDYKEVASDCDSACRATKQHGSLFLHDQ